MYSRFYELYENVHTYSSLDAFEERSFLIQIYSILSTTPWSYKIARFVMKVTRAKANKSPTAKNYINFGSAYKIRVKKTTKHYPAFTSSSDYRVSKLCGYRFITLKVWEDLYVSRIFMAIYIVTYVPWAIQGDAIAIIVIAKWFVTMWRSFFVENVVIWRQTVLMISTKSLICYCISWPYTLVMGYCRYEK